MSIQIKGNGSTMVEPLVAKFLPPNPSDLKLLLDGTDSLDKWWVRQ